MDFHTMKRKELQALCKKHKIPANLTNLEMANRLASLLKIEEEKPKEQKGKSCLKGLDDLGAVDDETCVVKQAKKVSFSPEDQTFEFEKTNPRAIRLAARRRKSMMMVEEVHSGEEVSALEDPGTLHQKTREDAAVDNRVKSTRTRGKGRKAEQADPTEEELLQKKQAEEDDGSKKPSRKRASILVDAGDKATKSTAPEAEHVVRRSDRNVAKPDGFALLTTDVYVVGFPKRQTRSDCPKNQDVEKASKRCSTRNTLIEANEEAVEGFASLTKDVDTVELNKRKTRSNCPKNQDVEKASKRCSRRNTLKEAHEEVVDGFASLTKDVDIVELPKRKTRSDCPKNQDVGKAFKRCSRRNTLKEDSEEAVDEEKEEGNQKVRVKQNTRQNKRGKGLNEAVPATKSASVIEQRQQRRSTRITTKKSLRAPREVDAAVVMEKSDAEIQETGILLREKQLRKEENASQPVKPDVQPRCNGMRKPSNTEHDEDLQADAEETSSAKSVKSVNVCEVEWLQNSVPKTGDNDNMLYNDSNATEDNQDKNQSLHQTTPPTPLEEFEFRNAGGGSCKTNTGFEELAETFMSKGKAQLNNKISTKKTVSTKEKQPGNTLFTSSEEGILLDFYKLEGQIIEDEHKEADACKQEEKQEAENLNRSSSKNAEIELFPSSGLKSSPVASRGSTEYGKTELETPVLKASSSVQCDSPLTSTSIDKFTGIPLSVHEPSLHGKNQPQHEGATLILSLEKSEPNNAAGEGSSIKNTELENHTQDAETIVTNYRCQSTRKSRTVDSVTAKEIQYGDALLISSKEGISTELYNLENQIAKDEETADLKSYPTPLEFQSRVPKTTDAPEPCPLISNEPINPQFQECLDHLDCHGCDNVESTEKAVTPTAMIDENSEGIDEFVSGRSEETAGSEESPKQGLTKESNLHLTGHEDNCDYPEIKKEVCLAEEGTERSAVVHGKESFTVSSDLEGRNMTEVSHEVAVLVDQNLKTFGEEGEIYEEGDKIRERLNGATVVMEEAVLAGRGESSSNELVSSDIHGDSTVKVHKVTPTSYSLNDKMELAAGLKEHRELIYADYRDFEIAHRTLENYSTEMYSGCAEEKVVNLEQAADQQISMHVCGVRDYSASDVCVSLEGESKEQTDAATPNVHSLEHCQLDRADANNIMPYELTQQVNGKVACLVEDNTVAASETTQDRVTPNCYSRVSDLVDMRHSMHLEEHENDASNDSAQYVLEGSEEELVHVRSEEEANASGENAKCDESGATFKLKARSPEAQFPVEEFYSADHTHSEDFIGHGILDNIPERTGEHEGNGDISCEIAHSLNGSELYDTDDRENFSLATKCGEADNKEYMKAEIHDVDSSEDAENMLPCSGGLEVSPSKEVEGLTPTARVDETYEGVDNFASEKLDDLAGSEGSHKPGLTKENNLQLIGHEDTNCGHQERKLVPCVAEKSPLRSAVLHENNDSIYFELTSYETALFIGDKFGDEAGDLDYGTLERSSWTSKTDGSSMKEGTIGMEQTDGDHINKQDCDSSDFTALKSLVHDKDESMQKNVAVPTGHFLEPCQAKNDIGEVECVLEDENDSTDQAKKDVFENSMKEDEMLLRSMDEVCFTSETLEGGNRGIETQVMTAFPEMSTMIQDDMFKTADVKGISKEANPTAENTESDDLGVTVQLYVPLPESSRPDEEMDLPEHACAEEEVDGHENRENRNFELTRWEISDGTFRYEAGDLNHIISETGLPTSGKYDGLMEEGIISTEQVADEQIKKQDCDFNGCAVSSPLVCHEDPSRLQEETAARSSRSPETYLAEHEDTTHGIFKEDEMMPQQEMNDEITDAKMQEVNMSSRKPTPLMSHNKRSILILGTPRRPSITADMKENSIAHVKREHLVDATALRPVARRKPLGELQKK